MRFRPAILGLSVFMCLVLTTLSAYAQPTWVTGYPQILSGATSADIKVQINSSGTVYYAIYKTAQSSITSALLKAEALGQANVNLVRRGNLAMTANTLQTIYQTTLTQNTTYHIYAVAESAGGLMPTSLISYTARFFPKRQQEFYDFSNSVVAAYLTYFPEDYYKTTTTFPLLVFLGGSGELTHGGPADLNHLLNTGLPQVINQGKDVPMIVASPQGINTWAGSSTALDVYIEFLKATYRVNSSQIFLTGLSDGGVGVFQYADTHPTKLRAIVPCSTWPSGANPQHFLNLPVWGFMGSLDTHADMVTFINQLQALGGNAKYTEYPGGHGPSVWNSAYNGSLGDDIYAWMQIIMGQPLPNVLPTVNAGVDQSVNLPLPQLQLTGAASDADGTIASYTWTKILGPSVTMTNTNASLLTLTNLVAGTYTFQVNVLDNRGGAASDQVTLYVYAAGAVSREFDVNITWASNKQGGTWNDFVTTSGGIVGNSTALFDTHNLSSTVTLSITAPFQDGTNNHGVIPGLYPNNVMQYYLRSTQTKVGALKISGLKPNDLYDLSIMSSNVDVWYPSDTRLTVSGQSVTINAKGNANQLANFPSIAPNANGEITITVAPATTASTDVGVINALVIKERPPVGNVPPVVSAGPDRQITLPLTQLQLAGTATDPDGTISSLLWTKISGPAVTMANTTTTTLTLTSLLAGTYVFQLRAQDNGGAATTDPVTVDVFPASIAAREFDINVTWEWNKQGTSDWNDFITTSGGIAGNSVVLHDKAGVTSPISLSISAPFQDGVNNHGVIPGLYPNNVMQYYLRSTQSKQGSLKLTGLNIAKQYDLSILSSNIDVWYPSDTRLTVQGQSATVNAKGNANQLVNFLNISPTLIGEIPILVAPATTNSANVGVINTIILTEHDLIPGGRTQSPDVVTADPDQPTGDYANVFPNPVEDYVNVEINSSLPTPEVYSVEFLDIRGAQVYSRQLESQDGTNHVSERISADFMQTGLYIMAIHSRQSPVQYFKVLKK